MSNSIRRLFAAFVMLLGVLMVRTVAIGAVSENRTVLPDTQAQASNVPATPQPTVLVFFIETATTTPTPTATGTDTPTPTDTPIPTESPTATATTVPPTRTPTATRRPPTATARPTATLTAPPAPPGTTPESPTTIPVSNGPVLASAADSLSADENKLLSLVNQERAKAKRSQLKLDSALQTIAHARAVDMITRGFYSHIDPATHQMAAKAMAATMGLKFTVSENFYSNRPFDAGFIDRAMAWLMGDYVHRQNLLLPYWNSVGVGVAGKPGGIAVVTQIFGTR